MKKLLSFCCALLLFSALSTAQSQIAWSAEKNVAPAASGNDHPRMVLSRSGNPMIVWNDASRCMFSRWNGTAFANPVMLNPAQITVAGADWMGPDIAAHGDTVYVVFKQTPEVSSDAHIYCMRSFDAGVTFSAPVQVDNIPDNVSRFPTVGTDDDGHPIVGFMKFDAGFGDPRWVVARSNDHGLTFSADVKASGWSEAGALICDCCPGAVTSSGNTVAMLYRDNKSNLRDTWVGISTDKGNSFTHGLAIDQQNWQIFSCPSTGPDGVILGDTLYSIFMNGASGKNLIYFSKVAVSAPSGNPAIPVTGTFSGLSQQNFPRIAGEGNALAIAWVQTVSGSKQCVLQFTNKKANGFPATYDTIALANVVNCDVALGNGKIFVVWQDGNSGTMKYRSGAYVNTSAVAEPATENGLTVSPNPSNGLVQVQSDAVIEKVVVLDMQGRVVYETTPGANRFELALAGSARASTGIYLVLVTVGGHTVLRKVMFQGTR
jgi:Secretion system C-terminal sorting domain